MKYEWLASNNRYVLRAETAQDVRFLTALRDALGNNEDAKITVGGSEPLPDGASTAGLQKNPVCSIGLILTGAREAHMDPNAFVPEVAPRKARPGRAEVGPTTGITEDFSRILGRNKRAR